MHRWKGACELRVWEKGHVSRARSDLKGKSPSNHMDEGWPGCLPDLSLSPRGGTGGTWFCAEPVTGDSQTAWSCDPPRNPPAREMEIGWEAGLRKGHGAVREMEKVMSLMNNVAKGMNCNVLDPKAQAGEWLPEAQGCVMMACHHPGGGDEPAERPAGSHLTGFLDLFCPPIPCQANLGRVNTGLLH